MVPPSACNISSHFPHSPIHVFTQRSFSLTNIYRTPDTGQAPHWAQQGLKMLPTCSESGGAGRRQNTCCRSVWLGEWTAVWALLVGRSKCPHGPQVEGIVCAKADGDVREQTCEGRNAVLPDFRCPLRWYLAAQCVRNSSPGPGGGC